MKHPGTGAADIWVEQIIVGKKIVRRFLAAPLTTCFLLLIILSPFFLSFLECARARARQTIVWFNTERSR